ncbi:carbohydrate binding domain-containing protein [Actinomadura sp. DC4]|uniref:carbohydrate binding domain-containing protein n=1 Tax=Actinomadura sp. DC4 TaxID=3055069 RepID=UPI0025B1CEC1|nr:carbohydrate binding domain-containing protein [Actinomadura sp. DC4]MDN3359563.1 glycosyl hydrolase family 18 protein [Actinomadura sp. DC4]
MRPRTLPRAVLAATALILAAFGLVTVNVTAAVAAPLPSHVFAPYFEAWTGDDPAALAQQSGSKYLTMAFIQATTKGSCTPYWNGDGNSPIASSSFGSSIASMQAAGGDVIPSFGGYTADNTGTEIADSCTDVGQIAAAYEKVITTYGITRIDLDTEDNSLNNTAGIDRRNKAVKQVEDWAASTGRTVQFSYTLPTTTGGLGQSGLAVLQNAVANGARIDVVNIMTFDYYDNAAHEMANDTKSAANGLHGQLAALYPGTSSTALWNRIGVTEMPGIDDFGPAETFTTADAAPVEQWAAGTGINTLSFWALQRDNGGCPGTGGAGNCSGISQDTWFFSHAFEPFTGGGGTPGNDFSVSASPSSAAVNPGGSTTATVRTAVTSGSAQSVALTASGAPSGVTASLSPASVTAGGTSTLTLTTTSAAAPGTYPITVTGKAASGSHSTTFTLTVNGSGGGSLVNGGFESGLSPWTCQPGGTTVGSPVHSGAHALLVAPTSSQTGECGQTLTLQPGHAYTLTGWVQGNYAYLGVSGGATASTWASSAGWTKLTVPFTTGSSGAVTVYIHGWYAQGNVYADDLGVS